MRKSMATLAIGCLLLAPGCIGWNSFDEGYYQKQVSWGHLMRMDSVEDLVAWTLSQHDIEQILRGLAAMKSIIVFRGDRESIECTYGIIKVYSKASQGWPDADSYIIIKSIKRYASIKETQKDITKYQKLLLDGINAIDASRGR